MISDREFLSRLRHQDIKVWVSNGKLKVSGSEKQITSSIRDELQARKQSLIEFLGDMDATAETSTTPNQPMEIVACPEGINIPLTSAQRRIWFLDKVDHESAAYNMPAAVRLKGTFDQYVAAKALKYLVQRHESLRSCYLETNGSPYQHIVAHASIDLNVCDLSADSTEEAEAKAQRMIDAEVRRPFDLTTAPLMRVVVLRMGEHHHILVLNIHHIIADAWSMAIFIDEFQQLYRQFSEGAPPSLPEITSQLKDYAYSESIWQKTPQYGADLDYWQNQLKDIPASLELPFDKNLVDRGGHAGAGYRFNLPAHHVEELRALCKNSNATLFMGLLSVFANLLNHHSSTNPMVIGVPVANRNRKATERLIAPLINSVALVLKPRTKSTFKELLQHVRDTTIQAHQHAALPFDLLLEAIKPERGGVTSPIFQVMFALQNVHSGELDLPDLETTLMPVGVFSSRLDLTLSIHESNDKVTAIFEYSTARFTASTIEQLAQRFNRLLENVLRDPHKPLSDSHCLSREEWHSLIEVHSRVRDKMSSANVVQLIQKKAAHDAGQQQNIAIEDGNRRISYRQLNEEANRLAHYLIANGVKPETCVGVCLNRSPELVITLLAVLKAGGAYVPIDPQYPTLHQDHIIADSGMRLLLTQTSVYPSENRTIPTLYLDQMDEPLARQPTSDPELSHHLQQAAYVIYTSGSTGKPKGVVVSHANLMNLVQWHSKRFGITSNDRATYMAGVAFDASAWEIWPYLTCGSTLIPINQQTVLMPERLMQTLVEKAVTIAFVPTPSAQHIIRAQWPDSTSLKFLLTGGDRLTMYPAASTPFAVVNNYGPTENSVVATSGVVVADDYSQPAIGRAIDGVETYILNEYGLPVPPGVVGELYLGGNSLARGYLNKPALTADCFIPNPFSSTPGSRLYRSGDHVRLREDGDIEFIERIDNQLKIRGIRVELGEIEGTLASHPELNEAAVIVVYDADNRPQLVAFGVLAREGNQSERLKNIKRFLQDRLPRHMVPHEIVLLTNLPLTANGKVDRKALIDFVPKPSSKATELVENLTHTEATLIKIWSRLLNRDAVGVDEDFFELGGHSMLIMQVVAQVKSVFDLDLPPEYLFEHSTVRELATSIDQAIVDHASTVEVRSKSLDIKAEAALPDQYRNIPPPPGELTSYVFLTGATGFLGAYLLREILIKTAVRVACLVRARSPQTGLQRIQSTLEQYQLWHPEFVARIDVVTGDLSKPQLGMSADDWNFLCEHVDEIYHNGAQVNFLYSYSALRKANVGSTLEIMAMATRHKTKPIHYVSTLSVFSKQDLSSGAPSEASLPSGVALDGGYAQTKWVSEQLLLKAYAHGLPITIYRPGRITGDSRNGIANTDDFFYQVLRGCYELELDQYPANLSLDMTPVDYVSQSIVFLAQRREFGQVYHLCNPDPAADALFKTIINSGHEMKPCPFGDWQNMLRSVMHKLPDVRQNAFNVILNINTDERHEKPTGPAFSCANTLKALEGSAITCPPVNTDLCTLYLRHLMESGFIPALNQA